MKPDDIIPLLPMVPYVEYGNTLAGMDCFGLIEFWHKEVLGIEIADRQERMAGPQGFQDGYEAQTDWIALTEPENHCMVAMRAILGDVVLEHGHCGMVWNGRVYHFTADQGFQHAPINDRQLRITQYLKHRQCKV